ncbi:zinc finger protein 40 isoform X2 [Dasypus novemcinctus]|uniref:zinc finger protein 40 isoform X2 n=1 Tax=Dasypus novemcinctus TaxID=9361 RepID=UPI00265E1A51|nr:zinc finger protein 40 isoform X2 [Dasypus novemcinctus]XP_058141215.1 zinc finger protein 40 isoform X2 [Dasypus novemcinctus]XP_058141216.1 zinc finger protein 40 isoform X2 [Dasypus novemcinctus]
MPRTKQIHPRNLRDKIEEAQKELNGAEVSKKEILEAGIKASSESLKGVKRKKIVTENHLKKIPKSPLRNPLQAKHKQNTEGSSFTVLQSASESHKKQNHISLKNGKQFTKQNGEAPGVIAEASKPEDSVSPKKPLFLQHPSELRRWRSEGSDSTKLNFLDGKCDSSSLLGKTRADNSECVSSNCSPPSSSYTNTAFDVLLKAMEPELSTLSQKGSSCAIKIEKLRPNRTVRSPSKLKDGSADVPSQTSQECIAESQSSPGTSYAVYAPTAQKNEQAAAQPISRSYHEHLVPNPSQHNQPLPGCPGFMRSLTHLQNQENTTVEHVYNIAVSSSLVLTSASSRTQVIPPNQPVDSAPPVSASPANPTQPPATPLYNSTPVASVVHPSVEQMCNLLKDQKPKKQGKYICEYCNRACAKPSVLLKHIRSHTGERPYPCVTCGFSFKTKSNLYKHKKSHAHTIKLGLVLQPDSGGVFLSGSPKALSIHSDVEDSGESEDEGPAEERPNDPASLELSSLQIMKTLSNAEALPKSGAVLSSSDHGVGDFSLQERPAESQAGTELPKVVVHPVSSSPLRTDSPKGTESRPELFNAQKQQDLQPTSTLPSSARGSSPEAAEKTHRKGETGRAEGKQDCHGGAVHAQLQRQQATDYSQEQQGKLLSPRSLGSTDSGYFSRSESADQTGSPPTPFTRTLPTPEQNATKNSGPPVPLTHTPAPPALPTGEKTLFLPGPMRPPLATKTLEERISKLISDNEALVDDKQLDSVKPRRTSLSRRGSIDSPKSYIFKDSFQFDLKPMGRRTSSSSDIPKSPFTPTEKSKQVFLLSVPSLDCLPITRSNSMPTTGYSAVPTNIIPPPHPLRGSQSFDDKIGAFYDDVFVSGPNTSVPQSGHPRTLVRQAAIEDSLTNESHVLGAGQPLDESYQGCNASSEAASARSKPLAQGTAASEKKKSHQGRGTMFECETCRNRYRKLENFENHKKFYCSELHGPKTKVAMREAEHASPGPGGSQPQILHYRVAASTGVWEQTPQIRKRRKMKSVGDDEELQQNESAASPKSSEGPAFQNNLGSASSLSKHNAVTGDQQPRPLQLQSSQVHLVARGTDQTTDPKLSTILEQQISSAAQEKTELKRHGTGISVIQHTNSLSRPSSFDKLESLERGSPVSLQELSRTGKPGALKVLAVSPEEGHPSRGAPHPHQPASSETLRGQLQKSSRKIPSERHVLGQPSRLVRQHNIQVPEILVTEEPDRDLDAQGHDQEKSETFSWPQRSETLSKLPTEKLPPKKKRLRLAEIEHSSTESSFDSTLSRSLSRESSLSHTSSFSASLDIEDNSKTEACPKVDFLNKAEFLVIPAGSNTLSVPGTYREMRRAASEQINCMQTLMEVSEFRSKSFDCGSLTPPQMTPPAELQPPTSPSGMAGTGHVPLLERRRGPLIRQISLNIAPESHLPPGNPSTFQNIAHPGVNPAPFQGPPITPPSSAEFPTNTSHSQTQVKDLRTETSNSKSASIFPVQQLFGIGLLNQIHPPPNHQNAQTTLQVATRGDRPDASPALCAPSESEDCFAPKYQLQFPVLTSSQSCSSNPVHALPSHILANPVGADQCTASLALPTSFVETVSNSRSLPPPKPGLCGNQGPPVSSFAVPVRLQSTVPAYRFATVTSLPQILVTQDLPSQPVFQANDTLVPVSEEQNPMPKSLKDPQNALPNPEKGLACEKVFSELGQHSSLLGSLPVTQKMSVGRLSPQQESAASSKRMLSPANSLDIAMEKHQKRAKDENGAVCAADIRSSEPVSSRTKEVNKQKKPVLVRQVCTTESLEGVTVEPDVFPPPEVSSEAVHLTAVLPPATSSPGHPKSGVREPVGELHEFESIKSSASLTLMVRNSPVPSEKTALSPLKSIDNDQERKSLVGQDQGGKVNIQEHIKLVTPLSVLTAGDPELPPFPSLKTTTSFTWCYLLRQKSLHLPQDDQKTSAYTDWTVSSSNPNPLGLPTKVALSLLNSKQKTEKSLYCQAITTHCKSDLLVYSSKWKSNLSKRALGNQKSTIGEFSNKDGSEINSEQDKENSLIKSEPRRIKIFDGGYKSNEEYVYVRGRGRGKYICEECGIRCKKPSMLKKHIRTHTDVRPYHCTYCNFSFKTKGNLTKHMKSKAHSKKCVDLGVSVGLIDEQDTEESDEKQRFSYERPGYDIDESDGPDEDENENEDDDEDSQAESVLSAAPSVTASPQHLPSRSGLLDAAGADEELRTSGGFSGVHTDPRDILPRVLLTKMTVLSAAQSRCGGEMGSPEKARQQAPEEEDEAVTHVDLSRLPRAAPRSPWSQMSIDYPESDEILRNSVAAKAIAQNASSVRLPPAAEPGPQAAVGAPPGTSPHADPQEQKQQMTLQTAGLPSPHTHLFSHLPLHSQQQSRTPYNMVPVGGIQVVPASLTYSTLVPIQAGPMQLTIPAVSVIHGTMGTAGDTITDVSSTADPTGVAEVSSVVPCIPIGQVRVPGLQNLGTPGLQPLPSLSVDTVSILGLANASMTPQGRPPGLALNAVGLQVLAANPSSQSHPSPQAHIPSLQIVNIALPALLPSVGQAPVDAQGAPEIPASQSRARETHPKPTSGASANQVSRTESPQGSPQVQRENAKNLLDPSVPARDQVRLNGPKETAMDKATSVNHVTPKRELASVQGTRVSPSEPLQAAQPDVHVEPPARQARSPDGQAHRPAGSPRRHVAMQFSDASSDDDEDRLVIAT